MAKKTPTATVRHTDPASDALDALDDGEGGTATATLPEPPAPAAKPKAKGKPKAETDAAPAAEPAAEPAADPAADGDTAQFAAGFDVLDIPVDSIQPNPARVPTPTAVSEMARSIRALGLLQPIVIGTDFKVVAGNCRLAAYKMLKIKNIPSRIAIDRRSGQTIDSAGSTAFLQTIAENVARSNFTPTQLGAIAAEAIKKGVASDAKDLAAKLGISAATISRAVGITERGTKAMQQALADDKITADAAAVLIARAGTPAEQDALLAQLLSASEGKVTTAAASAATSGRARKAGKAGRKPSLAPLSPEALKADATGLSGKLRKELPESRGGLGGFSVVLTVEIHHAGDSFARFDLAKRVQAAIAKLDAKEVNTELETARRRLTT